MKQRLIFHIGAHRTATTALQQYLFQNIQPLRRNGFLYPFKVRRHTQLIHNLFSKNRTPDQIITRLQERVAAHKRPLHTIIISDEDICMQRNLKILGKFRNAFDVKVVFSLRRQDLWLESWYLQNIKWQWNPKLAHITLDRFMARREDFHWIHYDRYVRHLEDVFGRENVILNVFEKQQMPEGPIRMFCDSIGLTPTDAFSDTRTINPSFSGKMSEFLRHLPLDEAPNAYRRVLTKACARIDQEQNGGVKGSSLLLAHDDRHKILASYEAGNRALAQRYFDRNDLFLEALPGPDAPIADMQLPQDPAQLMQDFVAPLLSEIIAHEKSRKAPAKSQPASADEEAEETVPQMVAEKDQ